MIHKLANMLIGAGNVLKNTYPVGTMLVTRAKSEEKEFLDPSKNSYTRKEIADIPIGEKMDLVAFAGQQIPDYFILPGT